MSDSLLHRKLEEYYAREKNLNCAETMLYAANDAYGLGLDHNALKVAAGFGGGMAIEDACGAVTGAIMVLGILFVEKQAHESTRIKELTQELIEKYREAMGTINCAHLKSRYRNDEKRCSDIIFEAGKILDEIAARERVL